MESSNKSVFNFFLANNETDDENMDLFPIRRARKQVEFFLSVIYL